jgi:hypothetical protein
MPPRARVVKTTGGDISLLRVDRRTSTGDPAEDGAGHQAGAAGVVVEEEAAGDFVGSVGPGISSKPIRKRSSAQLGCAGPAERRPLARAAHIFSTQREVVEQ